MKRALVMLAILGAVAHAAPPVQLSKAQLDAANIAAVARLPPVDQAKVARCKKDHPTVLDSADPPAAPAIDAMAACLRSAGALGAAVALWKTVATDYPDRPEGEDASRQLGAAYEAAGLYSQAAAAHFAYAIRYPNRADARTKLVRSICLDEQLGATDDAASGLVELAKSKTAYDPRTLCDKIRPIQPPKP
jgi:hypothetical protein